MNRIRSRPQPAISALPSDRVEGLRISDLAGLVFGYSLAALFGKAFLPPDVRSRDLFFLVAALSTYLWLGLAMSGPLILTLDRWRRNPDDPGGKPVPVRHTRAELCWLLIGGYWWMMSSMLVIARIPGMTWPLLFLASGIGVLSIGIGSIFRRPRRVTPTRAWTHRAAVVLLGTWPVVWALLIVMARSL